jgi:hypothetical protein
MSVVPPSNFWPPGSGVNGEPVYFADPPLFINNDTMSISAATDGQPGYVTIAAQPFGGVKDFTDGLKINTGQTITAISIDPTMAGATDTKLATQKATKDYVDSANIIDSVVNPLYLNVGALQIYDASAAQSGAVSTGSQSLNGVKTFLSRALFTDGLTASEPIRITDNPAELISYSNSVELNLRAAVGDYAGQYTGLIKIYPASSPSDAGGIRIIPATNAAFRVMHTPGALIPPTEIFSVSPYQQRMKLSYDGSNYITFTADATGILTIQPSSAIMRLAYDATYYSSFSTGPTGILSIQPTSASIRLLYDGSNYSAFTTSSAGILLIQPSAATMRLLYNDTNYSSFSTSATGILIVQPTSATTRLAYDGSNYANFTISPAGVLAIQPTSSTTRLAYDGSNYTDFNVSSSGTLRITPTSHTMRLAYDPTNYADFDISASGDLTINCIGNDMNLHSSDRLHVLNSSNCTGAGTGALQVEGGLYVAADEYVDDIFGDELNFNDMLVTGSNPFIRSTSTTQKLTIHAGNSPFNSANGAGIVIGPTTTDGFLDLFAARYDDIRCYAGTTASLPLAFKIGSTTIDFGINHLVHSYNITEATTYTNASFVLDGGLGVAKDIRCHGTIYGTFSGSWTPSIPFILQGTGPQLQLKDLDGTDTTSFSTSAAGDMEISTTAAKEIQINSGNPLHVYNATASTSTSTGALIIAGGLGVGNNVHINNTVYAATANLAATQDQIKLTNTTSANVCYISLNSSGNLNVGADIGGEVFVPSFSKFHVYSTDATAAVTVAGGITAKSIQFNPVRYREIDLLPSAQSDALNPTSFRQFGSYANWSFPDIVDSGLFMSMALPEDIVPNTQITTNLHWLAEEAPGVGEAVRIGVSTQFLPVGESALVASFTNLQTISVPNNVLTHVTSMQTPTPANMVASTYCIIRANLQRLGSDAADTYTGHIHIIGLTIRYQSSGFGKTW